jgi:hypothetical protein
VTLVLADDLGFAFGCERHIPLRSFLGGV